MGKCQYCNAEITLKENEINCPNCEKTPYHCWNCNEDIKGNSKECPLCGFFFCTNCKLCDKECNIDEIVEKLNNINDGIDKIIFIKDILQGKYRRNCYRKVPISYAKSKLRHMALKLQGKKCKSDEDRTAYINRFKKLQGMPIDSLWTINKLRENGQHGNELREVSNIGICMGLVEKHTKINQETGIEFESFKRIKGNVCKYVNWDNMIKKQCRKCKTTFPIETTHCDKCTYIKGIKKGQPITLQERISTVDFCQLNKKDFNIEKKTVLNGNYSGLVQ